VSETKLSAQPRSEFGKGAARRLRRAHLVPAVLYGHGTEPLHIALPGHETMLVLKQANALLTIDIEGGESQLALPKDVQRHPLRGEIEHVDLLLVRRGEKVTVDVALQLTGDVASGALLNQEFTSLSIEVEATSIPTAIEYSVEGAEIGTQVLAGQITLPGKATLVTDPDTLVAIVNDATVSVEETEDGDESAEGAGGEGQDGAAPAEA
jgi:large subunit ribosomal protein L25